MGEVIENHHISSSYRLYNFFHLLRRNIRHFGGDPDRITMGGASAGAGLVSLVSSLESVGPYIKGVIQQSGDALGPTTGFMPPTEVKQLKFCIEKNCY